MKYEVEIGPRAVMDMAKLKRFEPAVYKKALSLISELKEHPKTGTGHPKPLSNNRTGQWSRHISGKHRLVYEILDDVVLVLVLTAYGHYDGK
ncbi:MAG: Txe/YoeB family addiction module toxin [Rikenellaceae bacterium]|jgi:toxin YoeB|nr:Txe/YoeB family addiction module toxin [Rikenellaceae bacterium]